MTGAGLTRQEVASIEPPAQLVASTRDADAVAFRAHGQPRNPVDGRHRLVVAYVAADVPLGRAAVALRELADALADA